MSVIRYAIFNDTLKLWFTKSLDTPFVEDLSEAMFWPEKKYADIMKAKLDIKFPNSDLEIHYIDIIDEGWITD